MVHFEAGAAGGWMAVALITAFRLLACFLGIKLGKNRNSDVTSPVVFERGKEDG